MNIDINQPLPFQYLDYLNNVLHGDLGNSYKSAGQSVAKLISQVLPWTLFSVGLALLITFVLGIALGAIMAYKRDTWIDHLLSNIAATLDAVLHTSLGYSPSCCLASPGSWCRSWKCAARCRRGLSPHSL